MNLKEYKQSLSKPLSVRTISHLIKDNRVLLGYKKKGFGQGKMLGIGGKVEQDEDPEQGAIRELKEEIGIDAPKLVPMGFLDFYFPHVENESWNQRVYVYIVSEWRGTPVESEEIRPEWFAIDALPLDKMWDDDRYWLQEMLDGHVTYREFMFNKDLKVVEWRTMESSI